MTSELSNIGSLTPIHTDFGSSTGDLLVVEYDVPQTKVKQTLFYKYGQLSIPKWALIPAGILTFGLLTALCAIIVNSILSQPTTTVTYSQACSKTSKCKTEVGLTCGSQSKCVCPSTKYWYEDACVDQPTYRELCNQTTECRTDLSLTCAEIEGQCNCPYTTKVQTCDCSSTSYWTGSTCTARLSYLGGCSVANTSYQCISNLYCNGSKCICEPKTQYWNSTASSCYSVDKYLDLCNTSTSESCDASVSLYCLSAGVGSQCPFNVTAGSTSCDCANGSYWNGGSCVSKKTINSACFWSCECNSVAGLQCLNMTCVCPKQTFWSTVSSSCSSQMNYTQACLNTTDCDTTQGLSCYLSGSACNCPTASTIGTCDCLTTQYYDFNMTSCQTARLYNETCTSNYMCDSTLGLFCQVTPTSASDCSCPEPVRANMCDCNMTSFWDGIACVSRLEPNISCSFSYQCQTNYICIVNETDNGIFSDVCRCPLDSYFLNGTGCVPSKNYTDECQGSSQCYERGGLSCRTADTGLTCLDSGANPLPRCDCLDNYYFDGTSRNCTPFLTRNASCTLDCQCAEPYGCDTITNTCQCPVYYSSLNQTCVDNLAYGDDCSSSADCSATPGASMTCQSGKCGCNSTGFWSGSQCLFSINFRDICTSNSNCYPSLVCQNIPCIDSNKRCMCPSNTYYSSGRENCTACTGSDGDYGRYVINYPTSDICIGVLLPTSSRSDSLTFDEAHAECNNLTRLAAASTPQLISVHSQTELNCIARVLLSAVNNRKCSDNRFVFVGLTRANGTFYDGTPYTSAFSSPALQTTQCLSYCYNNNNTGTLNFRFCTDTGGGRRYGALCDYRVT